jgi:hypothetical protein
MPLNPRHDSQPFFLPLTSAVEIIFVENKALYFIGRVKTYFSLNKCITYDSASFVNAHP